MVDANTARLLDVDVATGNADTENDRQEYWPATRRSGLLTGVCVRRCAKAWFPSILNAVAVFVLPQDLRIAKSNSVRITYPL